MTERFPNDPRACFRCGTHESAYAPCFRFALDALYVRAANGAATRKVNNARVFGSLFFDYLDDRWDHITSAANDDRVADADVFALQLVYVVRRRIARRDTTDENRFEPRDGGESLYGPLEIRCP